VRAGRLIAVIVGALVAVVGLGATAAGVGMVVGHVILQHDGAYRTPIERFETPTSALVAYADLRAGGPGTVRVQATPAGAEPLFVGIGPQAEVEAWLAGTDREQVVGVRYLPFRVDTEHLTGPAETAPPQEQDFWVASAAGTGTQQLSWPSQTGRWALVVLNADGGPGVAADVTVGVETQALLPAGIVVGVLGLVLLAGGLAVLLVAVTGGRTGGSSGAGAEPDPAGATGSGGSTYGSVLGAAPAPYPVWVGARLDEPLSRWLWLVKWLLAIPHLLVLVLLWIAFALLTVVAGVVILVTAHYPRAIFDFNVGVLRWTWRVNYYAFRVLGTDRYPPFRLERDPDYPADLTVTYPARLSRGLVLVKWWLLAIPHYLVVGIFMGAVWFGWEGRGWGPGGLIGLLVIIALVVLLFTGRYPPALYDLVMGLNRWVIRVVAYAALMRDDYPPFRLDTGGTEPADRTTPPSG
jgi:hypothetical protein